MDESTVPKGKWDVKNLTGDENVIYVSKLENVVKMALRRRISIGVHAYSRKEGWKSAKSWA